MNQNLECYLRCYVNYQQDNWVELLPSAEYAYNQSVHAATQKTPFEMVLGYTPAFQMTVAGEAPAREEESQSAKEKTEELDQSIQKEKEL
jgi:hypothetical protein